MKIDFDYAAHGEGANGAHAECAGSRDPPYPPDGTQVMLQTLAEHLNTSLNS